eukprot:2565751-Prymnesium_polylepis.2
MDDQHIRLNSASSELIVVAEVGVGSDQDDYSRLWSRRSRRIAAAVTCHGGRGAGGLAAVTATGAGSREGALSM